jgi:chemotaxis signal transduction protein
MSGTSDDSAGSGRYLLVRSGGQRFALPASAIVAIQRDLVVYPVPGGRAPLLGIGQHAGDPVVVVDLLELVDGEVGGQQVAVVVTRPGAGGTETVGLAVDDAERIVSIEVLERATDLGRGIEAVAVVDDHRVRVVDPDRLDEASVGVGPGE